jgi:3-dehydroquinate synthase
MPSILVHSAAPYAVTVGQDLMAQAVQGLPTGVSKVLVVHSSPMRARADVLRGLLADSDITPVLAEVPDAEAGKTAEVLAFLWQVLGKSDFTRSDAVMALGGGAVTDLAGFVAASWLRGVAVVHLPTSVLAMVDAAVGGKTGINTTEGKNLVGAFHEPHAVWCDIDALDTLPRKDLVAGMAEIVKAGFIKDTQILELVDTHGRAIAGDLDGQGVSQDVKPVLQELMSRAIQVKADVVAADLKESFLREILNYGHTFGHAIEYTERYQWRHGAAVSVGMVYAAELARLAGKLDDDEVALHRDLLTRLGLPVSYRPGRWDALMAAMRRDKKSRGATLRFVVLDGIGKPVRLEGPDPALLAAAYGAVSEP